MSDKLLPRFGPYPPSPVKPDFLRTQITHQETQGGYATQELSQVVDTKGQEPIDYLVNRIQSGTKVINFGEYHFYNDMYTPLLNLMHTVEQRLDLPQIGSIAIELKGNFQKIIDRYARWKC